MGVRIENGNGVVDAFDVIMLIDYVFAGGTSPNPESIADVNGDRVSDVSDVIYLIKHVFSGEPWRSERGSVTRIPEVKWYEQYAV
jgi:hypothetical protein